MTTTARAGLRRRRRARARAPDGMLEYARRADPATASGTSRPTPTATEWCIYDGQRLPANGLGAGGHGGDDDEERERSHRGELRYTEVRPAAYNAQARLADMDADGIDLSVLYPTMLLGIAGCATSTSPTRSAGRTTTGSPTTCRGRRSPVRRGHRPPAGHRARRRRDPPRRAKRRASSACAAAQPAAMTGSRSTTRSTTRSGRRRPTPGSPIGFHPFLTADLPGACLGLRDQPARQRRRFPATPRRHHQRSTTCYFTQAISNPFDMMNTVAFLIAGGVCERFPDLRVVFLEANGGWIVPWLERLDHHSRDLHRGTCRGCATTPSEYFRRQCWISFDPDESTLGVHRELASGRRRPHRVGVRLSRTPTRSSPASPRSSPRR